MKILNILGWISTEYLETKTISNTELFLQYYRIGVVVSFNCQPDTIENHLA